MFQPLFIDPISQIIKYNTPVSRQFEKGLIKTCICLPFKLFFAAFDKTLSHGNTGETLSIKNFQPTSLFSSPTFVFSFFILKSIESQTNKQFLNKANNLSPPQPIYENATNYTYRISKDTKGPISSSPQYLLVDRSTEYINQNVTHLCSLFNFNHVLLFLFGQMVYLKSKIVILELVSI